MVVNPGGFVQYIVGITFAFLLAGSYTVGAASGGEYAGIRFECTGY
jgi:hypothetical protein